MHIFFCSPKLCAMGLVIFSTAKDPLPTLVLTTPALVHSVIIIYYYYMLFEIIYIYAPTPKDLLRAATSVFLCAATATRPHYTRKE